MPEAWRHDIRCTASIALCRVGSGDMMGCGDPRVIQSHSFGMNKNQTTFGFSQKWVFARMGLLAIIGDISWDIYISYIAKILKLMIFFVV